MVAMVASASGYGALRRFLSVPEGQRSDQGGLGHSTSIADSSKQRASIKWLLSKAFNNRVPDNLQEPFYRDHEDQEHLKPPIVGGLANAELYCLALANMYSDPNYHSLNHWNILQTLARKGVHVRDPPDAPLTETVLIQTNPIRMSAHVAVMESLMALYAREVVTAERVAAAAQRVGVPLPRAPAHHEEGLLAWVNAACAALNQAESEDSSQSVPTVSSLQELCDGTSLAALVSFYCPDHVPRASVRVGRVSSLQDCLHNLRLVQRFCQRALPHDVFHMMLEDVTYMRGSMRQNLVAMLADLFNMLEVHPAKCVKYPATAGEDCNEHGVPHKRCLPPPPRAAIPDLRAHVDSACDHAAPFTVPRSPSASVVGRRAHRSSCSTPERRSASPARTAPAPAPAPAAPDGEEFVVHRGKGVTTLSSMARHHDERGVAEGTPAGRPSNWEDARAASYAGRRSRRSSVSDDSQLTVENFGGSQDRLDFCGRHPAKQLATLASMRKISAPAGPVMEPTLPARSLKQDIRGSLHSMYDELAQEARQAAPPSAPHAPPTPHAPPAMRRQLSSDTITLRGGEGFYLGRDVGDGDAGRGLAERRNGEQTAAQVICSAGGSETEDAPPVRKKSATFSTPPPATTTWQQQSMQHDHHPNGDTDGGGGGDDGDNLAMAAQLNNIRLKLEEKRRRIELEKRKMEQSMKKQRQQVGQQAFLQAVTRSKGGGRTPGEESGAPAAPDPAPPPPEDKPFTLQEISSEAATVESRWLREGEGGGDARPAADVDGLPIEEYQQSIAKMNSSLHDIQTDIARLVSQQSQLQNQQLLQQQQQIQQQQHKMQLQQQLQSLQPHNYQQYPAPPVPQPHIPSLSSQYSSQHNVSAAGAGGVGAAFGSSPHLPLDYPRDNHYAHAQEQPYAQAGGYAQESSPSRQFFLHETPPQPPPQRRTWAQHAHQQDDQRTWQLHQTPQQHHSPHQPQQHHIPHQPQHHTPHQPQQHQTPHQPQQHHNTHQPHQYQQPYHEPQRTWRSPSPQQQPPQDTRWNPQSFVISDRSNQQAFPVHYNQDRYHNGDSQNHLSYTVINPSPAHHSQSPPIGSPQRRSKTPQRQGSLPEHIRRSDSVSLQQLSHAPIPAPTADDMEPQNISFIGNAEDDALQQGINRLNISSGTRTYRIPSPTRPFLNRNSFQQQTRESSHSDASAEGGDTNEKGFYISFDNDQPKRPKPPLRPKRGSPRKERTPTEYLSPDGESPDDQAPWQDRVPQPFVIHQNMHPSHNSVAHEMNHRATPPRDRPQRRESNAEPAAIVIAENVDPNSAEEMEKKKERIMMLSLQRRARAEEARARAEAAAAARRARDEAVAEQRAAKREETARRRQVILAQYKIKKAVEEAEREGKVLDRAELMAMQSACSTGASSPTAPPSAAKLRRRAGAGAAGAARARPKTIHVDSGAVEAAGLLGRKQGSATNLTAGGGGGGTMRRDYYRGSQDSLADRAGLYRDSPEEGGGVSPGAASGGVLGRRGSYRTSRERDDEPPAPAVSAGPARGRNKYPTYQNNFKAGRKSSSLMNLCDSGLGRATPPRRAASPGAALASPASGPGSLPGGIGKRRLDDGSDASSTHSSIMDYSGLSQDDNVTPNRRKIVGDRARPRLYKQPATKSNRGIMLNAVEYCVFPGAVNREAKRRVLEEVARSESKHFLVLFRDAGCQFRALYSYCPDTEDVSKLYGTGPRHVNDRMFDKFFKYNSGSKCFSQIHTKHLTVTIDAFTIHNSLWQGKKVNLPSKKDMALVI